MTEFGYGRVSTAEQDPQLQIDALLAAGVPQDHIYLDRASGVRTDRPALTEVISRVAEGDRLTVWRLDRLGRSLPHLVTTVDDLAVRSVAFRSLTETIDTSSAAGRLMLNLIAAFAAFERDLTRERTVAGLAAVKAAGTPLGRPSRVHPDQVVHIHQLAAGGKSHREIANLTGLSRPVVGRVLRNEIPSLSGYQPTPVTEAELGPLIDRASAPADRYNTRSVS